MSKPEATPEERAAAEALARALEGEGGGAELPEDALEAAALLRYSQDGGALSDERRQAILAELLAEMGSGRPERAPQPAWRRWLLPFGGLAGAAAALVLFLRIGDGAAPETPLPAPGGALLQAQLEAARPGALGDALALEMRAYRREVYAALSAHYGEGHP